jgi:hypothetical protein
VSSPDGAFAGECAGITNSFKPTPGGAGCKMDLCATHVQLCVANKLLELSTTAAPVDIGTLHIPPQSTAANVALAERAMEVARDVLEISGLALIKLNNAPPASDTSSLTKALSTTQPCNSQMANVWAGGTTGESQTYGSSLAASFVEAYYMLWEASGHAARDNVAAADEAWSRYPSRRKAAYFAQSAPILSRSRAAQLLVGGPAEGGITSFKLPSGEPAPMCEQAAPSAPAQVAVNLIRASGISPSRLASDNVRDLLTKGKDALSGRLSEILATPDMVKDAPDDFPSRFGLTVTDFQESQQFLVAQHRAFGRSHTATLPAAVLPGGKTMSFTMHAATVTPPSTPSPVQMNELVQRSTLAYDDRDPDATLVTTPYVMPIISSYIRRGAAQSVDFALTVADTVVSSANVTPNVANVLSPLLTQGVRQRPHRLQVCMRRAGTAPALTDEYQVKLFAHDQATAQQIRLVLGRDMLECATRGRVDGSPCDLTKGVHVSSAAAVTGTLRGFPWVARFTLTEAPDTIYAIKPKPGVTAGLPGAFEAVAGFTAPADVTPTTAGVKYCTLVPVVPELASAVAEQISPDTDGCAEPEQTCAGLPQDQRIPLEDELSDDGDAYESSWKHYLALARQAAGEADMLGEELISRGLEMDERSELALEQVESLCGAVVNVDDLFQSDLGDAVGSACPANGVCPNGYVCTSGKCRKDTLATVQQGSGTTKPNADAARLSECLGATSNVDFVALGSHPVCFWHTKGDERDICPGAGPDQPCPFPAVMTSGKPVCGNPPGPPAPNNTNVMQTIERSLNLFVSDTPTHGGQAAPCDALRVVRELESPHTHPAGKKALDAIVASNYFDPPNLRSIARNLTWEPSIGAFSSVVADGMRLMTNGSLRDGISPYWPCTLTKAPGDAPVVCPAGAKNSLFCGAQVDCSNVDVRAALNERWGRAVLAVRVTTGVGLEDLKFPIYWGNDNGPIFKNASDYTLPSGGSVRTGTVNVSSFFEYEKDVTAACRAGAGDKLGWRFVLSNGTMGSRPAPCEKDWAVPPFVLLPGKAFERFHHARSR